MADRTANPGGVTRPGACQEIFRCLVSRVSLVQLPDPGRRWSRHRFTPTWMLLASISTLVCWDLMHFKQEAGAEQAQKSTALLENIHLQALAVAVATGLVFSLISANITIQLPFIAVAALTVTAVGGLAYGMHLLAK